MREGVPVKIILAAGLAGLLGFALFSMLHADVPFATKTYSQITIHGTPVCVTRQDHGIVAKVGECDEAGVHPNREFSGKIPFHALPGMNLPPGHPPIDGNLFPGENRRVPI